MKNKIEFEKYMIILGEIHDKVLSKIFIAAYWEALKPYDGSQCIEAFKISIKKCKFFPKPAELINFIEQFCLQPANEEKLIEEKLIEDKALVEANKIIEHFHNHGATKNPGLFLSDPITEYLMSVKWPYQHWASHISEEKLEGDWKRRFIYLYRMYEYNFNNFGELPQLI